MDNNNIIMTSTMVPALVLMAAVASGPRMFTDAACPVAEVYEPAPVIGTYIENGNLHWPGEPKNRSYPPSQYRRRSPGAGILYEVCACARKPCMIECCKPDQAYEFSEAKCSEMSYEIEEGRLVPLLVTENETVQVYPMVEFHILFKTLNCVSPYEVMRKFEYTAQNFTISENGSLCPDSGLSILTQSSQFCLYKKSNYMITISDQKTYISLFIPILSYQFMLLTLLVYTIIKKLRNVFGKSLMCNIVSLIVSETIYIAVLFTEGIITKNVCATLAYLRHFFRLAFFFWLNIMCFDLWRTFSKRWPIKHNYTESKTFTIYCIYAWGLTSLFSIFAYFMDTYGSHYKDLQPGFSDNCRFNSEKVAWIYYYGPMAVILISNFFMFIHTTVLLYNKMEVSKIFNQSNSNRSINQGSKQRFVMHLKLLLMMGIYWCHEISIFIFKEKWIDYIWLLCIIIYLNYLNGVFFFLIFVCNKRVFQLIREQNFGPQSAIRTI